MTYEPGHATVPPPRSRTRLLVVAAAAVVVLVVAVGAFLLTRGGSSSAPLDVAPAACVDALRKQFADAVAAGSSATEGARPPACDNVTDKGLEAAATKVLEEAFAD